jgi:surface carbohydrate biosynthesis protein
MMSAVAEGVGARAGLGDGEPVVILVDNRVRDLNVAALIAHHLEALGVRCHLEPLEAFRAVVGAYRPGMIVFNHLNASHLASWSRRLAEIGILVGVLPNEGFVYSEESRPFMAGRYHNPHVDHFFCWNALHRDALLAEGKEKARNVHIVGVPRFDFYFEPWSKVLPPAPPKSSGRPRVLVCTNFVFAVTGKAAYREMAAGGLNPKAATLRDHSGTVEAHQRGREKFLDYLGALVADGRYEILLRPHPNEDHSYYQSWIDRLSADRRARLLYDPYGSITSLILSCDLEISCESCTTAIESWVAHKPTIALLFEKHPLLYRKRFASLNFTCENPGELPDMIAQHLAAPDQAEKRELRAQHLETWAATPDGRVAWRIACMMADALRSKRPADWSKLAFNDRRRSAQLKLMRSLGQAYHFDPLLWLKRSLFPKRYVVKDRVYKKSIKPNDERRARQQLRIEG